LEFAVYYLPVYIIEDKQKQQVVVQVARKKEFSWWCRLKY